MDFDVLSKFFPKLARLLSIDLKASFMLLAIAFILPCILLLKSLLANINKAKAIPISINKGLIADNAILTLSKPAAMTFAQSALAALLIAPLELNKAVNGVSAEDTATFALVSPVVKPCQTLPLKFLTESAAFLILFLNPCHDRLLIDCRADSIPLRKLDHFSLLKLLTC